PGWPRDGPGDGGPRRRRGHHAHQQERPALRRDRAHARRAGRRERAGSRRSGGRGGEHRGAGRQRGDRLRRHRAAWAVVAGAVADAHRRGYFARAGRRAPPAAAADLRVRIGKPAGVAALVLGLTVTGIGVGGLVLTRHSSPAARPAALTGTVPATVPATLPVTLPAPAGRIVAASPSVARPVAAPVSLDIPAIAVSTTLIRLGLTATGALQVPASTSVAGWYTGSSRPGAIGPAVIAGHIDSYTGPGVFYRLDELRPGDRVYIGRTDGTLAVFRVTSVRTYAKAGFPTQAVYGPAPDAELRLITCGGVFDASRGSYLSNVVVYAVATS